MTPARMSRKGSGLFDGAQGAEMRQVAHKRAMAKSLAKSLAKTFPPLDDAQSAHHSLPARLGTADARTLEPLYGGFSAKRD